MHPRVLTLLTTCTLDTFRDVAEIDLPICVVISALMVLDATFESELGWYSI